MTKHVRIENADCNMSVEVVILVEDLQPDGSWKEADRQELPDPTSMSNPHHTYLTSTRRLVIVEQNAPPSRQKL